MPMPMPIPMSMSTTTTMPTSGGATTTMPTLPSHEVLGRRMDAVAAGFLVNAGYGAAVGLAGFVLTRGGWGPVAFP